LENKLIRFEDSTMDTVEEKRKRGGGGEGGN